MKSFFKYFLAGLLALTVFFVGVFLILLASGAAGSSKPYISNNTVLTLNVGDVIEEQSKEGEFNLGLSGASAASDGLFALTNAIRKAKTDDKIAGIYLKLGISANSWATLTEVRNALLDFKQTNKFIYAYGDVADQKSLYLSTTADTTFINPVGGIEFKGLAATGTFFKGTLDKLGIKPEVFYCGKFKGASEPYRLEKFSEPNRSQMNDLLNDFYSIFLNAVSVKSGQDTIALKKIANDLSITRTSDAVNAKLIDGAYYDNDMQALLRKRLSIKDEKIKIKYKPMSAYMEKVGDYAGTGSGKAKIAVLFAQGEIVDGAEQEGKICSTPMMKEIRRIAQDESVKALVLRINSPGGSALASENIYHELMALKKKKPIVVSMGDVAASGGYYMACAGDSVFAQTTTITGSIGVVGMIVNAQDFLNNKLGVTTDVVKTAEHADMPNLTRTMTDLERKTIQNGVDSVYALFKKRVTDARKLSAGFIDSIAEGHVYSGVRAKQLGLVDDVADINRAINAAAQLAQIKDYKMAYYPFVKDPVTKFMNQLKGGGNSDDVVVKKALGADYLYFKQVQNVRNNMNKVMAVWPFSLEIK
jgi:protease IV